MMMMMTRHDKVISIARRIEATRGRLAKKKAKREAEKRKQDAEQLSPDEYRDRHGRCPDGFEYDSASDTCKSQDPEPGEPKDEQNKEERKEVEREAREAEKDREQQRDQADDKADEKTDEPSLPRPPSPKTPGDWLDGRKERGDYLEKLFEQDFDKYQSEVNRMRESGELPDRETATMLAKIKNVDDLPEDVVRDKEKLAKIIAQQDAQRRTEQMVLDKAEQELKDFDKRREVAIKAGKKPPTFNAFKFLQDIEDMYNRDIISDPAKIEKMLAADGDKLASSISKAAPKPGEPAYRWKEWWRKVTRPIPVWTPGRGDVVKDLGLDKLIGGSAVNTTARTSPGVIDMETRQIGFPPYDRDRQPRRFIADQPSGRPAFPPYDTVETVEYRDRDARMQGFPPYDGKGEPHDTKTIGLPPYNKKAPHKGRGFPPYRDGTSVYEQRRRTVDLAVK